MTDEQPPTSDASGEEDDENLTTSTKTRWEYLGSLLAFITVVAFLVMVGAGVFGLASLSAVSGQWFYVLALLVLTAGGWTFGSDLLEAYRKK